ncbi:MAG: hypothetical protein ABEH77_03715 [Halobacteriaceae archaeon]
MADRYGETWVYESIVGAVPGIELSNRAAVAVQFLLFEALMVAVAAGYGLWDALLPGTAAIGVAAVSSAFMLDLGGRLRGVDVPDPYRRLLFGSSVEVVLGLLAYAGLLTYLFVYDPRVGGGLLAGLLGPEPPLPAVYLLLLVLWDVCYRIGTGWWAAVVALWRSYAFEFDADTAAVLRSADRRNVAFALLQTGLLPFVADHPLLALAVAGHVLATVAVAGLSARKLRS